MHVFQVHAQKFYLHQYKDSLYNFNGIAFLYDTVKSKYLFCIKQYDIAPPKKCTDTYILTDTAGNILHNKQEFSNLDTGILYKDFYRINTDRYLMVGYKSLEYKYNTYRRVPYMRVVDTNLNIIFENNIYTGDTTEFYVTLHSIINKNGNLVISGYIDSYANAINHKSKVYFYEVDISGNLLKHKYLDTSNAGSVPWSYSIVERNDSMGYLIINEATTEGFLHLDTNFIIKRIGKEYLNYDLMKNVFSFGLSYLISIDNSHVLQSYFRGYKNKYWHWIVKYKDDMTFQKYAITEAEPDTLADFAHRPGYNHPLSYDNKNHIIYCLTNTRTDHQGVTYFNSNFVQVSKYDTALNLIWTRFFGGYDYYYFANSIFTVENKQCMVLANRTNMDTSAVVQTETFIFKLDSLGTITSIINVSNPTQADVYVYPNPASHTLHFVMQNIAQGTHIALYNINGTQVAKTVKGIDNHSEIPISHLPVGIYTYRIFNNKNEILSGKWIKQ